MGQKITSATAYTSDDIKAILALFEESTTRMGDARNTIKVVEYKEQSLVVKSFKTPNLLNRFVYGNLRKSKAQRSFENSIRLLKAGIEVPAPVGYVEQYYCGLKESYYICQYQDHDFTFRSIATDDAITDKKEILIAFTAFIYQMHEADVFFLDNSPGNTLIKRLEDGYLFSLVDLNRMKFYQIPLADRLKNFERLGKERWMYQIMGTTYAQLSDQDADYCVQQMWQHAQDFQAAFQRKKKLKKRFKPGYK